MGFSKGFRQYLQVSALHPLSLQPYILNLKASALNPKPQGFRPASLKASALHPKPYSKPPKVGNRIKDK